MPTTYPLGLAIAAGRLERFPAILTEMSPYVDRIVVAVDSEAPESIERICRMHRVEHFTVTHQASRTTAFNAMVERLGTDWVVHIDTDERWMAPERLRALVTIAEEKHLDGWRVLLRHFTDTAGTIESNYFPPSLAERLFRGSVRYRWRVHQERFIPGQSEPLRWEQTRDCELHHLCFAYRSAQQLHETSHRYWQLLAQDVRDGRDWQGEVPDGFPDRYLY